MTHVRVYSRPGCHLCEDALAVIEAVRGAHPFTLEVIDIESDDALLLRYLERIPVVAVDGQEQFEFFVDAEALTAAVARVSAP